MRFWLRSVDEVLAVVKPEEETEDATEGKRASEKPAGLGKTDQSHEKQTKYDDQTDGMSC